MGVPPAFRVGAREGGVGPFLFFPPARFVDTSFVLLVESRDCLRTRPPGLGELMMSRARRWIAVAATVTLFSGCANTGETSAVGDTLWTVFYLVGIVLAIIGAKLLVESHRRD